MVLSDPCVRVFEPEGSLPIGWEPLFQSHTLNLLFHLLREFSGLSDLVHVASTKHWPKPTPWAKGLFGLHFHISDSHWGSQELKPERGGRSWSGGYGEVLFTVLLSRTCPTSCLIACMTTCPGCHCPEGTGHLSSLSLCFLQTRVNSRICFLVTFEDCNSFHTKGIEQGPAHRRKYKWLVLGPGRHLSPQKFESQL